MQQDASQEHGERRQPLRSQQRTPTLAPRVLLMHVASRGGLLYFRKYILPKLKRQPDESRPNAGPQPGSHPVSPEDPWPSDRRGYRLSAQHELARRTPTSAEARRGDSRRERGPAGGSR